MDSEKRRDNLTRHKKNCNMPAGSLSTIEAMHVRVQIARKS